MKRSEKAYSGLKGFLRRSGLIDRDIFRGYLRDVCGVVHVGAHTGQERHLYAQYKLNVIWIEPLPELFAALKRNIAELANQQAIQRLVTDKDGVKCSFHVTSNEGGSSSIYKLDQHKDIWPDVKHERTVELESSTLASLLVDAHTDLSKYDALIMDTQGSELLVLKGAEPILDRFRYVRTEVAEFSAYEGCCQLKDIEAYLTSVGFVELARKTIAEHPGGGAYLDVVYRRAN